MEHTESADHAVDAKSKTATKAITDLHELIQAILKTLPPSKPWQRQLLQQLTAVDRCLQVLRIAMSLEQPGQRLLDAREELRVALRVAQRYVAAGRADQGTRMAVLLASELGQKIESELA